MKHVSLVVGTVVALAATGASAQSVDLTGTYRCIQMCRGDLPAHVTQNGPELNVLTEAGVPFPRLARLVLSGEPDLDRRLQPKRRLHTRWHAHSIR